MADDYSTLPRSWTEARKLGVSRYFTGKPCQKGHLAPRFASGANCTRCAIDRGNERNKRIRRSEDGNKYREMRAAQRLKWIQKNPEARERYYAKQRKGGPWFKLKGKIAGRVDQANARARRLGCDGVICCEEIFGLMEKQAGICANTACGTEYGDKFHIDHNMPLSLKGRNVIENIQLLCAPCNKRKHAMHPIDWAQMNGLLL